MRSLLCCALVLVSGCGGGSARCGAGTTSSDGTCINSRCATGTRLQGNLCVVDPTSVVSCGAGTHASNNQCVADEAPGVICGAGTHAANQQCVPDSPSTIACGTGTHAANGQCVPDAPALGCGAGTHDNNGVCAPDDTRSCGTGTHENNGVCLPDTVCGAGTIVSNGACVPDPSKQVTCGSGTQQNGNQCVSTLPPPVTCGPGTHADGMQCLPDNANPVLSCGAGTHQQGSQCVLDALSCGTGTHAVDNVCVPDQTLSCGAGTHLVNGTCLANDSCGPGTHDDGGNCVANPPVDVYEVRLPSNSIAADGFTQTPVLVLGTHADGTPITGDIVLTIAGVAAGALTPATVTLGENGGTTFFVPFSSAATASCLGSFTIQVALVAAPAVIVGTSAPLTTVAPTPVGSATPCLVGGNQLHIDGVTTNIANDTWSAFVSANTIEILVEPQGGSSGDFWNLDFSSEMLHQPLAAQVYRGADRYPFELANHPGMDGVSVGGCNTLTGNFQIEDLQLTGGTTLKSFTATFERTTCDSTATVVRGCVHYGQ